MEFLDRQDQILDILQSYFRHAATYNPDTADAGCTTYFSKAGMDFIYDLASIASKLEPTSPLFSTCQYSPILGIGPSSLP